MKATEDEFVNAWLQAYRESRNRAWVAKQLGVMRQAVSLREADMRKRGVNLPDLPKRQQSSKDRLNEMIKRELEGRG
jgi:hypothetical protein